MDLVQLSVGFAPYRELIKADGSNLSVSRNADNPVFWDDLVSSFAEAWKAESVSILFRNALECTVH